MLGNIASWLLVAIRILGNVPPFGINSLTIVFNSRWDRARGSTRRDQSPNLEGGKDPLPDNISEHPSLSSSLRIDTNHVSANSTEMITSSLNIGIPPVLPKTESSAIIGTKRKRSNEQETHRKQKSRPAIDHRGRPIIYIDDVDFVTFHNILYFLNTGRINLQYQREEVVRPWEEPEGCSLEEPCPVSLFRAADMYLIEPLRQQSLLFLIDTCTINNISDRLFDINVQALEDLKTEFLEYMVKNFNQVIATKEWRETVLKIKDGSTEEMEYQLELLLDITTGLRRTIGDKKAQFV
jgi:hypothetical protein